MNTGIHPSSMKDIITPWTTSLSNFKEKLYSPNGQYMLEYQSLMEIAMGAPVSGSCTLINKNASSTTKKSLILHSSAGLPFAWNESSTKVAFPIWSTIGNLPKARIAVFDTEKHQLVLYQKKDSLVWIKSFTENIIYLKIMYFEDELFNIETEEVCARLEIT